MSESNFREIQLNTKQVVFLFMACVVALLGVFLLGVQVGHGVSNEGTTTAASTAEPANDPPAPTVMPGPTQPKPEDFKNFGGLPDKTDGKPAPAATSNPPADPPAATTPAAKPAETPAPKSTPAPEPPSKAAAKPSEDKPVVSPTAIWFVQVDSFGSKENAEKQVGVLKGKGQPAFVFTASGGGAKYKTRIGPMERNAADSLKNRLSREGFRPTVIK